MSRSHLHMIRTLLLLFLHPFSPLICSDPIALYLTWQRSPESTMTIQWITPLAEKEDLIEYRADENSPWLEATGSHVVTPNNYPYLIHRTELTQLQPDSAYSFRIGKTDPLFKFRTMPAELTSAIHFVVGGDVYHDAISFVQQTNHRAAQVSPQFALLGGDLAYSSGSLTLFSEKFERWLEWLITWKMQMVTPEGYLIPLIPAIGNHDVLGGFDEAPENAQFFYALFGMSKKQGYRVLDFGNYLSLLILDSGHTHPIDGKQTAWLATQLASRQSMPHKVALYHVGAYPSVRSQNSKESELIRKNWVPLFEHYGLNVAFEHHDHAYKRTHLILDGKIDPTGVLYMGDGAWGIAKPRTPKTPKERWYLAKSSKAMHFISVSLSKNKRVFTAIDSNGKVIDTYEQHLD